ncbi:MAG: hypothetical protein Q7S91_03750, partial [Aquabacterium sp.]|nr:hypothetical protein [Aquabacterium sp.]
PLPGAHPAARSAEGRPVSEWWSYRAGDFLMFSPRVYARLFELVNEAWWPLPWLLPPVGLLGVLALARGRGWAAGGAGLGAAWLFCAVVFVHGRYLPINWAVAGLLPVLLLLAVLLPLLGWQAGVAADAGGGTPASARARPLALATWALLLHPLLAPLAGLGWRQAEVIALAPDPTAIATLSLLAAMPHLPTRLWRGVVALAWLLVLAWCLFSGFMLATMGSWNALVLLVAAALAMLARRWPAHCAAGHGSLPPPGR